MSLDLGRNELAAETYKVSYYIKRKYLSEPVKSDVPEAPVEAECEAVLITCVPDTEKHCRNKGDHNHDHDSLQVDAVPYVCTLLGNCVRDKEECLKSVECRMKESELAAILKSRLDLIYKIS